MRHLVRDYNALSNDFHRDRHPLPDGKDSAANLSVSKEQFKIYASKLRETYLEYVEQPYNMPRPTAASRATCDYILDDDMFISWLQAKKSQLLFITGPSGCGKSVLANHILTNLERGVLSTSRPTHFSIGFFCSSSGTRGQDDVPLFEYLVRELLLVDEDLPGSVLKTTDARLQSRQLPRRSPKENVRTLLASILQRKSQDSLGDLYIVLDGLDQIDPAFADIVLTFFSELIEASEERDDSDLPIFKVLVSCQPLDRFTGFWDSGLRISINSEKTKAGVLRHVESNVRRISKYKGYARLSNDLENQVIESLLEHADGNFMWLSSMFRTLYDLEPTTLATVHHALKSTPKELEGIYNACLIRIARGTDQKHSQTLLRLVLIALFVFEPVRVSAVSVMLAIGDNEHACWESTEQNMVADLGPFVAQCEPLLRLEDGFLSLSHYSVVQHFEQFFAKKGRDSSIIHLLPSWFASPEACHCELASICLRWMLFRDSPLEKPGITSNDKYQKLLSYAVRRAFEHVYLAEAKVRRISRLASAALSLENPVYIFLRQETNMSFDCAVEIIAYFGLEHLLPTLTFSSIMEKDSYPKRLMSFITQSATHLMQSLLYGHGIFVKAGVNPDSLSNALRIAAFFGYTKICEGLLQLDAEINSVDKDGDNALGCACMARSLDTVILLLRHGANIEQVNSSGWTPLLFACDLGHLEIAVKLIESGASIAHKELLNRAITGGNGSLCSLLISMGVHIPPSALCLAAKHGRIETSKLLATFPEQLEFHETDGITALHFAAANDEREIAQVLIDAGCEVDTGLPRQHLPQDENRSGETSGCNLTPLFIAMDNGAWSTAKLLLENNSSVETPRQPRPGSTPEINYTSLLCIAAACGAFEMLELLLKAGVPVDEVSNGTTALREVCITGDINAVSLLLRHGANPSLDPDGRLNAFHCALQHDSPNHLDIIKLLIASGADLRHEGRLGRRPLETTLAFSNIDGATILLDEDDSLLQDLDSNGISFVLQAAGHYRKWDFVNLFLKYGASTTDVLPNGRSLLHVAAYWNQEQLLISLLDTLKQKSEDEYLAMMNRPDINGDTPLLLSAETGSAGVFNELMRRGASTAAANAFDQDLIFAASVSGQSEIFDEALSNFELGDLQERVVQYRDYNGLSYLHAAASAGFLHAVDRLIDLGAEVCAVTYQNLSVLHIAAEKGRLDVVRFLVKNRIAVDLQDDYGHSALHYACMNGHADVVRELLHAHANCDVVNLEGKNPLTEAVTSGDVASVSILLDRTGAIDNQDRLLKSALSYAATCARQNISSLLMARSANYKLRDLWGRNVFQQTMLLNGTDTLHSITLPDWRLSRQRKDTVINTLKTVRGLLTKSTPIIESHVRELCRILAFLDLDEEATHAAQLRRRHKGIWPSFFANPTYKQHECWCDTCGRDPGDVEGQRFFCTICDNIDFCEAHMKEYLQGNLRGSICRNHKFCKVDEPIWLPELEYSAAIRQLLLVIAMKLEVILEDNEYLTSNLENLYGTALSDEEPEDIQELWPTAVKDFGMFVKDTFRRRLTLGYHPSVFRFPKHQRSFFAASSDLGFSASIKDNTLKSLGIGETEITDFSSLDGLDEVGISNGKSLKEGEDDEFSEDSESEEATLNKVNEQAPKVDECTGAAASEQELDLELKRLFEYSLKQIPRAAKYRYG